MGDTDLGFPEQRSSAWLTNRYFPSKVGGKPAWLELNKLPAREQLCCVKCQQPKAFLCQIYAPFDDEHNFHRSVFIFVCRSVGCLVPNSADNYTVLRSQLPMQNEFYSVDPPAEDGDPQPAIPLKRKLCIVCGCLGPLACGRCHSVNYCSSSHQRAHWPQHKQRCNVDATSEEQLKADEPVLTVVFPECEIAMEQVEEIEPDSMAEEDEDGADKEKERLAEFEKLAAAGKTGELQDVPADEIEKYAGVSALGSVDDKHFRKFRKEVSKEPEQILRYKRNGSPLWIGDVQQTFGVAEEQLVIPKCEVCGGNRQFEFQVMPQMLLLLKDEHLDWGILAVYSCAKSCKLPENVGYVQEFILKQDILSESKH